MSERGRAQAIACEGTVPSHAMTSKTDHMLSQIVTELCTGHGCHSVLLYGSRARGDATEISDYDLLGITARGTKHQIAKRVRGKFWDLFVYPEHELTLAKLRKNERAPSWKNAVVLFEQSNKGTQLVKRLRTLLALPFKHASDDEIAALKVWFHKQLERIERGGVTGNARRAELQAQLISDYFVMHKMRYLGPKAALAWLGANDQRVYRAIEKSLAAPSNLRALTGASKLIYGAS